jgi:DNA-binding NarL/FixJ family response regulator
MLSRDIAERLTISIKMVETHKANAMTRMGTNSRVDVVHDALLQGWLQDN